MGVLQGKIAVITGRNSGIDWRQQSSWFQKVQAMNPPNNNFPARLIPRREQFPFLNAGEKGTS